MLQAFPNQSFWMTKSCGIHTTNGDTAYENASKRPHQLLDGPEADGLLPNKKPVQEIPTSNLFSRVIKSNVPAWRNTFCFQSIPGQFTQRLFDTKSIREVDIPVHSVNTEKVILGRSGIEEPYCDQSFALSMSQTLDENVSLAPYNVNTIASDLAFDSNLISMGQTYNHVEESASSKGSIFHKQSTPLCRDSVYKSNSNVVQDSCSKGQSTLISFGGSNDDDDANNSGRIISSYEFLMAQSAPQLSETPISKDLVGSRTNGFGTFSSIDVSAKKGETKVPKKVQSNNFPSNVRSLLSTGMLDGVLVKYIAWSREVS